MVVAVAVVGVVSGSAVSGRGVKLKVRGVNVIVV